MNPILLISLTFLAGSLKATDSLLVKSLQRDTTKVEYRWEFDKSDSTFVLTMSENKVATTRRMIEVPKGESVLIMNQNIGKK